MPSVRRRRPRSRPPAEAAPDRRDRKLAGAVESVVDGELVLLSGPGDELLPDGLDRLSAALAADPEAAYAYGIVQVIGEDGPEGIANHFGLDSVRAIHTPVLARRSVTDLTGLPAAHVREFVARSPVNVPAEVRA